jgi:hypothetical protein
MTSGERGKRLGSLSLTAIAMDQYSLNGMAAQCGCNPSRAPPCATEDHHALAISIFNERNRECGLRFIINVVDVLTQIRTWLWSS